jgi:pimeloyl-ACP methyl ester carboxylesterase
MLNQGKHYISLSAGRCFVRIAGPSGGVPLVLIHGATVPGWEFERVIPYLTAAGFRVVCPDLFGHGKSDRPDVHYDAALFTRQIEDLMYALSFDQRAHLLSHSMGCVIASHLVVRQPQYFGNVAMVAPMLDFTGERRALKMLELPLLGEALMHAYALPMLVRRRRRRYRDIEDGRFPARFEEQLRIPGFGRALLSLIRSGMLGDQSDCYRLLDATANSTCVVRGSEDGILSGEQLAKLGALLTKAQFVEIGETPHSIMLTHPERIAPVLIRFFRRTRIDTDDQALPLQLAHQLSGTSV